MPRDFPTIIELERAAEVHGFRKIQERETIDEYRIELAKHVYSKDKIEAWEIKFGIGWNRWSEEQSFQSLYGDIDS